METYNGLPLVEFTIDGEGFEVDAVAIVDAPAIKKNFQTFNDDFADSYNDYPEAAKENAKIALRWADENGWGECGTDVGKQRANQLAKGESISRETIARMAAFERHRQNSDKELGDGCGRLMWLAWGGDEGIEWAQRKLKQIDKEKFESYGGEGSGCTGDNCGRPSLNENDIKDLTNDANSVAEKLGVKHNLTFGKTPNGVQAYVSFKLTPDGKYVMSEDIVINKSGSKEHIKQTIEHEMRHIWQSKEKGFYITKDGMHWEGKVHISVKEYNKILNGMSRAKTKDDFNKWKKKYVELPWEKDADDFAKIKHEFKSNFIKGISYKDEPVDLIEIPEELLNQEFVKPSKGEREDEFIPRCISTLVDEGKDQEQAAAICYSTWQTFSEQKQQFSIQNEEKRIISGALMLAETPIYRNDKYRGEYYCKFSKDTIEKIAVKFFDKGFQKNVNFMHDGNIIDGFVMFESFISDKSRGVLPMQGYEDCPDGSWFCSFKVENEKAWQIIKEGNFKGFSVEGAFGMVEDDMFWAEFLDVLKMALS